MCARGLGGGGGEGRGAVQNRRVDGGVGGSYILESAQTRRPAWGLGGGGVEQGDEPGLSLIKYNPLLHKF